MQFQFKKRSAEKYILYLSGSITCPVGHILSTVISQVEVVLLFIVDFIQDQKIHYHPIFSSVYTMKFDFYCPDFIYSDLGFDKFLYVSHHQPFLGGKQWKKRLNCVKTFSCYQSS